MPLYSSVRREKVSSLITFRLIWAQKVGFRTVLDAWGKVAFQDYLNMGGNFVGIHSASDSLNTTTFFGQEIGQ